MFRAAMPYSMAEAEGGAAPAASVRMVWREAIYPMLLLLLLRLLTPQIAAAHGLRVDRAHVGGREGGRKEGSGLYKISCCDRL